jgi:hypothetical protein
MTEDGMAVTESSPRSLGVGALLNETFSLYFKWIHWFAILAFMPLVITSLIMVSVFGAVALTGNFNFDAGNDVGGPEVWNVVAIGGLLFTVTTAISTAMVTTAVHDARLGQPPRLDFYIVTALRNLIPVLLCSLITSILIYGGLIALVLPGIWFLAVFFIVVPAIILDGAGFASLGRSARLTQGYRWSIVGYILLLGVCMAVMNALTGWILTPLLDFLGEFLGAIVTAIITALTTSFFYLGPALVHARLIEIKEGAKPKQVVGVFE